MDVLLMEPPPTNRFGNMRQFGSIGSYKASIAYPPIDLMKIAGYLRRFGRECSIYDANTLKSTVSEVMDRIDREAPRLLVFTTSTTTIRKDMVLMEKAKEKDRDIIIATFGAHLKGAPFQSLLEHPCLDVAIYGDPEYVVRALVETEYDLNKVGGICFRRGGDLIRNPSHPEVLNLDEYGIAAHDLVDPSLYHDPFARRSPLTITYGQVGCTNQCVYCMSTLYGKLRTRTVPHFLEELKFVERLGFKEVFFIDCGFTNQKAWTDDLLNAMVKSSLDLTWWCLSRADRLTAQMLSKMKDAGCHSVGVGVESASARILKNIKKNIQIEQVRKAIHLTHKAGLRILLYFQFGLPGETKETMEETLRFALQSGADLVTFGIATPVPGTSFYDFIESQGFFTTSDWNLFDPTLKPVYEYPDLTSNEIFEFSKKAYREFYMRPSFILSKFLKQRSLRDLRTNASNFLLLLRKVSEKTTTMP